MLWVASRIESTEDSNENKSRIYCHFHLKLICQIIRRHASSIVCTFKRFTLAPIILLIQPQKYVSNNELCVQHILALQKHAFLQGIWYFKLNVVILLCKISNFRGKKNVVGDHISKSLKVSKVLRIKRCPEKSLYLTRDKTAKQTIAIKGIKGYSSLLQNGNHRQILQDAVLSYLTFLSPQSSKIQLKCQSPEKASQYLGWNIPTVGFLTLP